MPDEVCAHFKELGDYEYRPAREVADAAESTAVRSVIDVDILGHIFEQSITDLERLRESLSSAGFQPAVSRVSNPQAARPPTPCRLEVGDTAGWKPALQVEAGKVGHRREQEGAVYNPGGDCLDVANRPASHAHPAARKMNSPLESQRNSVSKPRDAKNEPPLVGREFITGHFKTNQQGANPNRPL